MGWDSSSRLDGEERRGEVGEDGREGERGDHGGRKGGSSESLTAQHDWGFSTPSHQDHTLIRISLVIFRFLEKEWNAPPHLFLNVPCFECLNSSCPLCPSAASLLSYLGVIDADLGRETEYRSMSKRSAECVWYESQVLV